MQPCPAVSLACRDDGAWRAVTAALQGAATASLLAWGLNPLLGAVAGGLVAGLAWYRAAEGHGAQRLAWDGQGWQLDEQPGQAQIALDLGVWMLVRFDAVTLSTATVSTTRPAQRHWLPLSAAAGAWAPMRAALVATAGRPATWLDPKALS